MVVCDAEDFRLDQKYTLKGAGKQFNTQLHLDSLWNCLVAYELDSL